LADRDTWIILGQIWFWYFE